MSDPTTQPRVTDPSEGDDGVPTSTRVVVDALTEVLGALKSLSRTGQDLYTEIQASQQANLIARKRYTTLFSLQLVMLIVLIGLATVNYNEIQDTRQISKVIQDATTPGGERYERGQTQLVESLEVIEQRTIEITVCSRQPDLNDAQFRRCVDDALDGP